jgi:hypothetical protein
MRSKPPAKEHALYPALEWGGPEQPMIASAAQAERAYVGRKHPMSILADVSIITPEAASAKSRASFKASAEC